MCLHHGFHISSRYRLTMTFLWYEDGARSFDRAPVLRLSSASVASLVRRSSAALEGQHALEHEALELSAIPDVRRREVEVLLVHPLRLREKQRGHEPASAVLPAVHGDVVRDAGELTLHRVVARAEIELVAREAVDALVRLLPDRAVLELRPTLAGCRLDVAEELQAQ